MIIVIVFLIWLMCVFAGIGAIAKVPSLRKSVMWLIGTVVLCGFTGWFGLIVSIIWAVYLVRKHKKNSSN